MNEVLDKIREDAIKTGERLKKDHEKFMDEMKRNADELDQKSANNFSAWRDFLYKYFVVVTAIIGGSGILQRATEINSKMLDIGIIFGLSGVLIGIIGINIHFYAERKRLQIEHYISTTNPYDLFEHPDSGGNIKKAIKMNLVKITLENKEKIRKLEKDKENNLALINKIKSTIKADKRMVRLMKYFGEMFGYIEYLWFVTVILSLSISFISILLILTSLIK